MNQQNKNQSNKASNSDSLKLQNKYSNTNNCDRYGSVEPLPESSRPRRDGPGGEDAK